MTEQATEHTARRSSRAKMAARIVLALALIVLIFWYLLKDISLADVWAAITAMTWTELVSLAVVAGWKPSQSRWATSRLKRCHRR